MPILQMTAATLAAALIAGNASAATIYLCRAYGGGSFWSNAHCHQQRAVILRMTTVPDGMPFDQQVDLARQAAAEGQRLAAPPVYERATQGHARPPGPTECQALEARIQHLDALARQPQSGPEQDRLKAHRQAARSRQMQLNCR